MSLEPHNDDLNSHLVNQTIKLSGIKQFSQTAALADDYSYQPNFILVDANSQYSKSIFGDIVPLYNYDDVVSLIVTSWDSLYDFILHSSSFMVCLLSIANQLLNNAAYYSYIVVVSGYQQVMELPTKFNKLKSQYQELLEIVSSPNTRSLLWLEVKLDAQTALDKLLKLYEQVWNITQKFYLSIIVVACLFLVSFSSVLNESTSSFLTNFLNNTTIVNSSSVITSVDSLQPQVASASAVQDIPVKKILEHTVEEGETLSLISDIYAINVDTIRFNNKLAGEPELGKKLFIPWTEGYIHNVEKESSPEELAQLLAVSAEELKETNKALYNSETNTFAADTLILAASTDFVTIQSNLDKAKEREQSLAALAEQEKRRQRVLSQTAVSANTYAGAYSDEKTSGIFIWPSQGSISRCVQPGHIACDLANFSAPPIFAMQGGTVVSSGWDSSGYGYMILIDHGTINGRNYKTLYAHMSELYVNAGQSVNQGQAIGKMGSTGYSTGVHVHFEIIVDGMKMNPLNYLG